MSSYCSFSSEDEFQYPEEDDYDEDDDEDDNNVPRVMETVDDDYDQDLDYSQQEEYVEGEVEDISLEPPELFQNMSSIDAKIFLQV